MFDNMVKIIRPAPGDEVVYEFQNCTRRFLKSNEPVEAYEIWGFWLREYDDIVKVYQC